MEIVNEVHSHADICLNPRNKVQVCAMAPSVIEFKQQKSHLEFLDLKAR